MSVSVIKFVPEALMYATPPDYVEEDAVIFALD
jgi:hypothetical protein